MPRNGICPCVGATGLYPAGSVILDVCPEEKCSKLGCEWPCKTCGLAKYTASNPEHHPWNGGCLAHKIAMQICDEMEAEGKDAPLPST